MATIIIAALTMILHLSLSEFDCNSLASVAPWAPAVVAAVFASTGDVHAVAIALVVDADAAVLALVVDVDGPVLARLVDVVVLSRSCCCSRCSRC